MYNLQCTHFKIAVWHLHWFKFILDLLFAYTRSLTRLQIYTFMVDDNDFSTCLYTLRLLYFAKILYKNKQKINKYDRKINNKQPHSNIYTLHRKRVSLSPEIMNNSSKNELRHRFWQLFYLVFLWHYSGFFACSLFNVIYLRFSFCIHLFPEDIWYLTFFVSYVWKNSHFKWKNRLKLLSPDVLLFFFWLPLLFDYFILHLLLFWVLLQSTNILYLILLIIIFFLCFSFCIYYTRDLCYTFPADHITEN